MKAYPLVTVTLIFICVALYLSGNNAVADCQELNKANVELLPQCPTLKN